ncbi:MAG TPA: hypothetical protein VGS13_04780 [Stellaceae bacterium]|nr:hypothetical protein [Stellaceae bacterium]
MVVATQAGSLYALMVFFIGFILGTIRVLLIAPRLGETGAVLLETPIILGASWYVCRWCVDRLDVRRTVAARSLMGISAFVVLMLAELALSVFVLDRSAAKYLAAYTTLAGAIGLGAQVVFALFPLAQGCRR